LRIRRKKGVMWRLLGKEIGGNACKEKALVGGISKKRVLGD